MLIDTLLDLAGLDYDAPTVVLRLDPVLPLTWPHVGLTQTCPAARCRIASNARSGRPSIASRSGPTSVGRHLDIGVTCPGLADLGPWTASPTQRRHRAHNHATGRLEWSVPTPGRGIVLGLDLGLTHRDVGRGERQADPERRPRARTARHLEDPLWAAIDSRTIARPSPRPVALVE